MGAPYAHMSHPAPVPTPLGGFSGYQNGPAPVTPYPTSQYNSEWPHQLKPDEVMVFDPQEANVHLFTQHL